MEKSGFFNANLVGDEYDREYLAQDFAAYFASFIGNGVFPNPSTGLQTITSSGMQVAVLGGEAWINGYWYQNSSEKLISIAPSSGTLDRIDSIVVRHSSSGRVISVDIKTGAPAVSPIAPAPTRNADMYELVISHISVKKGAIVIKQSDISDTRLNKSICGIVHGVVDQIDTSTLGQQLQGFIDNYILNAKADYDKYLSSLSQLHEAAKAEYEIFKTYLATLKVQSQNDYDVFVDWLTTFKTSSENEFNSWFETIKGILDEEVASRLLAMIQELQKSDPTTLLGTVSHTLKGYIICATFVCYDGVSAKGFGVGGFGGGDVVEIPNRVKENEMLSADVFIPKEYHGAGEIVKLSELSYIYDISGTNKSILINIRRV